jgi:hypothetical protein
MSRTYFDWLPNEIINYIGNQGRLIYCHRYKRFTKKVYCDICRGHECTDCCVIISRRYEEDDHLFLPNFIERIIKSKDEL